MYEIFLFELYRQKFFSGYTGYRLHRHRSRLSIWWQGIFLRDVTRIQKHNLSFSQNPLIISVKVFVFVFFKDFIYLRILTFEWNPRMSSWIITYSRGRLIPFKKVDLFMSCNTCILHAICITRPAFFLSYTLPPCVVLFLFIHDNRYFFSKSQFPIIKLHQ